MKTEQDVITSTSTINGVDMQVKHTLPTYAEMVARLGEERIRRDFVGGYVNRHHILNKARFAGEVLGGRGKAKTKDGIEKETAKAQALMEQIKAGEVLDFWAFVPKKSTAVPAELKMFWDAAELRYNECVENGDEERAIAKFGECTIEAFARALKVKFDAQPDLF